MKRIELFEVLPNDLVRVDHVDDAGYIVIYITTLTDHGNDTEWDLVETVLRDAIGKVGRHSARTTSARCHAHQRGTATARGTYTAS